MEITTEYDKDFYAWLMKNAMLIRNKQFTEIDTEYIAEELESMGKREKRELLSRLTVLISHLLKWKFQSIKRSRSWKNTILTQQIDIKELIDESPSLRYEIENKIMIAYEKAKLSAESETGINKNKFPKQCPFSLEKMLEVDFFPESSDVN